MKNHKSLLIALTFLANAIYAGSALAGPECTTEPKEQWQNQDEFKATLEDEYRIKKFKVTSGNCYEIYGWDGEGRKVEIYFNPITGEKVKEKVKG